MTFVLLGCLLVLIGWLAGRRGRKANPRGWCSRASPPICRRTDKPAWVRREIIHLKALMPDAGCRRIADTFNRRFARHADIRRRATVGKSFVADTVRRHRYEIEMARRKIKHRVPPPVPQNLIWAMDLTGK